METDEPARGERDGVEPPTFRRALLRAVALPLILITALATTFLGQILYLLSVSAWVDHTDRVIARAYYAQKLLIDMETGLRGDLVVGDRLFLEPYNRAEGRIDAALADIRELVVDNPDQSRNLHALRDQYEEWHRYACRMIDLRRLGAAEAQGYEANARGKAMMDAMRARIDAFVATEEALRAHRIRATRQATGLVIGASIGVALILGGVIAWVARRQLLELADTYRDVLASVREQAESLRKQSLRLQTLHETDQAILRADSPAEVGQRALEAIRRSVHCQLLDITLFDLERRRVEVLATLSEEGTGLDRGESIPLEEFGDVERLQRANDVVLDDLTDPIFPPPLASRHLAQGIRSVTRVPMIVQDRLIGSLNLAAKAPNLLTDDDVEVARELAAQLAIAIEQSQLRDRLRHHAEELEAVVHRRTRQLRDAISGLETFAYSVAHDLRAPLRAMQGLAQALLEDYGDRLDKVGRDYARRVVAASRKMDTLIQDLLAYGRLSLEDIRTQQVPLEPVLLEVLAGLSTEIHERQAEVDVRRPLPAVWGHRPTLAQVLTNLIANALKFTAPGVSPRVRLWSESHDGRTRLWVEDNGIGIAPDHQVRIFRIFERLHGVETYPGTGIGLAIVQKGVERMGGSIGVESAPGRGSRFWIELPGTGGEG